MDKSRRYSEGELSCKKDEIKVLRWECWSFTRNNKDASMTGIERPMGRGKEMRAERAVVRPGRTLQATVTTGLLL